MSKLSILIEFWEFFWYNKKWWLMPIVFILLLLSFFIIFFEGSVFAPFIYTLY